MLRLISKVRRCEVKSTDIIVNLNIDLSRQATELKDSNNCASAEEVIVF